MKKLALLAGLATLVSAANAGTYFYDDILDMNSPTFDNGTGAAGPNNAYHLLLFTVTISGNYVIETASPNTNTTGGSNALDTYLRIMPDTWVPANGTTGTLFNNDDFSGALTVLPGPYAGTVGNTGTGFTGAQPASRLGAANLTAGTNYFLVNTSFRENNYPGSGTNGLGVGHFYTGISGQGDIIVVPEPGTFVAIGIGLAGLAMLRRRK